MVAASCVATVVVVFGMCVGCVEVAEDPPPHTDAGRSLHESDEPAANAAAAPDVRGAAGGDVGDTSDQEGKAGSAELQNGDIRFDEPGSETGAPQVGDASQAESPADAPRFETRQRAGRSDPLDLTELFIDSAPVPEPSLTPELQTQLDHVRTAMRARDFAASGRHLQSADSLRRTAADEQAYERMLLVHALWTQGWSHAAAAAGELAPGDRINTWAGPALVQDKTQRQIMLRIDGVPRTFSLGLGDMEVRLAAALVEHRARTTGLALDAHVAALWIFNRENSLDEAREAIIAAVERGPYVDHLIAELKHRPGQDGSD